MSLCLYEILNILELVCFSLNISIFKFVWKFGTFFFEFVFECIWKVGLSLFESMFEFVWRVGLFFFEFMFEFAWKFYLSLLEYVSKFVCQSFKNFESLYLSSGFMFVWIFLNWFVSLWVYVCLCLCVNTHMYIVICMSIVFELICHMYVQCPLCMFA
jgi:hypothetical protein